MRESEESVGVYIIYYILELYVFFFDFFICLYVLVCMYVCDNEHWSLGECLSNSCRLFCITAIPIISCMKWKLYNECKDPVALVQGS